LVGSSDETVSRGLAAWRLGELYIYTADDGTKTPFLLDSQQDSDGRAKGTHVADGQFITDTNGKALLFLASDLTAADTTSKLRKAIKTTLDLFAIGNPMPKMRRDVVVKLGQEQNAEYLPHFEARLKTEADPEVIRALNEAVYLTRTADADATVR